MVHFKERIDVAEAGRARRHPILEQQERALPRPRRQHGRTDGDEQLLPRAHLHVDARHGVEDLGRMVGADILDRLLVNDRISSGVRLVAVAIDRHDVGIGRRGRSHGWRRSGLRRGRAGK